MGVMNTPLEPDFFWKTRCFVFFFLGGGLGVGVGGT